MSDPITVQTYCIRHGPNWFKLVQTRCRLVQTRFRRTGSDTVQTDTGSDTVQTGSDTVQTYWIGHGSDWFRLGGDWIRHGSHWLRFYKEFLRRDPKLPPCNPPNSHKTITDGVGARGVAGSGEKKPLGIGELGCADGCGQRGWGVAGNGCRRG